MRIVGHMAGGQAISTSQIQGPTHSSSSQVMGVDLFLIKTTWLFQWPAREAYFKKGSILSGASNTVLWNDLHHGAKCEHLNIVAWWMGREVNAIHPRNILAIQVDMLLYILAIQVDMILNYTFYLGLPGICI